MPGIMDTIKAFLTGKAAPADASATAAELTDKEAPVDAEELAREISGPVIGGVRSILANGPLGVLDPVRLAGILNAAAEGQAQEYYILAEEMEEKFPQYQSVLKTRKLAVSGLPITIDAASDEARHQKDADLCRDYIKRGRLKLAINDILDAHGKGFSATELVWDTETRPWYPRLKYRTPRFFQFDRVDQETLLLIGGPDGMSGMPTPLPAYKFIIHRSAGKSGTTVRGGLARSVAWCYLFQNMALKDWVVCAELYGMPIRVGKYDKTATDEDRRALLRAVMNIAADAAAIIPDSMVVEFVNAMAGITPAVYKELCEYLDQLVSKLVLGQTATTDATAGGLGGSQGNVHNDVRDDYRDADADMLAATLTDDLFKVLVDLNHGKPVDGLYPTCGIGVAEKFSKEDLEIVTGLVALGVDIEESTLRDRAGYPDPPETRPDGKPVKLLRIANSAPVDAGPQGGAQGPQTDPTAPELRKTAASGLLVPVKASYSAIAASAGSTGDAIDDVIAGLEDQWVPIMAPLIEGLEKAVAASTSWADLKVALLSLPDDVDPKALTQLLAESTFAARLAGEAGVKP